MSDNSGPAAPSVVHLSRDDYRIIVTWVEVPANVEPISGKSDKARSDEKPKVKKKDVFKALAKHLLKHTSNPSLQVLSGRNMQQRWRTYMQRYYKTLKAKKLEAMCPQFSRMKVLFGAKASTPIELGAPPSSLNQEIDRGGKSGNSGDSDSEDDCSDVGATSAELGGNGEVTQLALPLSSAPDRLTINELLTQESSEEQSASARQETMTSAQELRSPSRQEWSGAKRTPSSSNSPLQNNKRQKNADTKHKKQRQSLTQTAHEHHPLSAAQNASAKDDYRYLVQKLEEEKRQWDEKLDVERALWEAEFDFRQRELDELRAKREEEKRQWDEEQKAEKFQREAEAEYRRLELEEQRAKRQHELLLELLRQNKSVDDISIFMSKFGS